MSLQIKYTLNAVMAVNNNENQSILEEFKYYEL